MKKIRMMAKKIKKSRQEKRESLKLMEITKEMDDIIGQIDKIQKPGNSYSKKLRRSRQIGYNKFGSRDKKTKMSTFSKYKMNESDLANSQYASKKNKKSKKKQLPYSSQYIPSKSKEFNKGSMMYSRLAQQRKARKLNHFKNMMQRPNYKKSGNKYNETKHHPHTQSSAEEDPLKLTIELDDIFKTISGLEQQDLGNTYHKERQKKLKTLMRSSKLENIRKTMNIEKDDSQKWLKSQSDMKSHEHLDKNFTMKKCPKCHMYFPLEKIARHCKRCGK
jgi:hypothetical protein